MKTLSSYTKEQSMYYRHVLTYNFSDDDTRSSFRELVEEMGYIEAEDQSTYVLPYGESLKFKNVVATIVEWSKKKKNNMNPEDFVQLFYLGSIIENDRRVTKMASRFMKYNTKTKSME